jgi:hypothetical protein
MICNPCSDFFHFLSLCISRLGEVRQGNRNIFIIKLIFVGQKYWKQSERKFIKFGNYSRKVSWLWMFIDTLKKAYKKQSLIDRVYYVLKKLILKFLLLDGDRITHVRCLAEKRSVWNILVLWWNIGNWQFTV